MAYELLNYAQVTPPRLHAMVKLVSRLQAPTRKDVIDLLQPSVLVSDQSAAKNTYIAAVNCNIVSEAPDKTLILNGEAAQLESMQGFQLYMQKRVLGVIESYRPNYLFNLYSAWYIVQNERVFQFIDNEFATRFVGEVPLDTEFRAFNKEKFVGWRTWAAFLGLGWLIKPGLGGRSEILAPCASNCLKGVLDQLLTEDERVIKFGLFAERLAELCPELDGGSLFTYCWEASRGGERRGTNLSLALSTGLRQLHDSSEIELIRQADATDIWQLYPAEGQLLKQVTHIRLRGKLDGIANF